MPRARLAILAGLLLVAAILFASHAGAGERRGDLISSKVVLAHQVDTTGFGTWTGLRLGDLDGDNRRDIVLAQHKGGQNIGCVTAMTVTGKVLWRIGEPNAGHYRASSDLPVQIHDLDADGDNEVVYCTDGRRKIVEGRTGRLEKEVPLPTPKANDCLCFADLSGSGHAGNIIVKTRYTQAWALGPEALKPLWTFKGNTGHYPWPYDVDGDGRDELICGFSHLDDDGTKRWEADLPGHSDGIAVGDVDSNPANGVEKFRQNPHPPSCQAGESTAQDHP